MSVITTSHQVIEKYFKQEEKHVCHYFSEKNNCVILTDKRFFKVENKVIVSEVNLSDIISTEYENNGFFKWHKVKVHTDKDIITFGISNNNVVRYFVDRFNGDNTTLIGKLFDAIGINKEAFNKEEKLFKKEEQLRIKEKDLFIKEEDLLIKESDLFMKEEDLIGQNKKVTIYIIKLKHNKYYVGKTELTGIERIKQHEVGYKSAAWVIKYEFDSIERIIENCDHLDEDKWTIKYMIDKGIENVRGGIYCEIELSEDTIAFINRSIRGATNKCYRCGGDHFIKNCLKKCTTCGRNHDTKDCYAKTTIDGKDIPCYKCSKVSHSSKYCKEK